MAGTITFDSAVKPKEKKADALEKLDVMADSASAGLPKVAFPKAPTSSASDYISKLTTVISKVWFWVRIPKKSRTLF